MTDTMIDLDPAEQSRREAAERLNYIRDGYASFFEGEIELARDKGMWQGSLADGERLAERMANAAMREFLKEADVPVFTVPLYFDLKDPT